MAFHRGQCCGAHTSGLIKRFISQSENINILESGFNAQGSVRGNIKGFKLQAWKAWEMSSERRGCTQSLQEERGEERSGTLRHTPAPPAPPAAGGEQERSTNNHCSFNQPLWLWSKFHYWFLYHQKILYFHVGLQGIFSSVFGAKT